MYNPFFKNVGPLTIDKLLSRIDILNKENYKQDKNNIKILHSN